MSSTTPEPQHGAAAPTRRGWRRFLRAAVVTGLGVVAVLVLVWSFRSALLAPFLRTKLEAELTTLLSAQRVTIGALAGDWIREIEVRDLAVEGSTTPLREARVRSLQLRYSLLDLVAGRLTGLHSARLEIASAVLDTRGDPHAVTKPSAGLDVDAWAPFAELAPDGLQVHCDALTLRAEHGERTGALDLGVGPVTAGRDLDLAFAGATLRGRLSGRGTDHRFTAHLAVADPGALVDLFAPALGVRGGSLAAELSATQHPPRVEARIDLADLVREGRVLSRSHLDAALAPERLTVATATLDLPGLAVRVRDLALPNPFAGQAASLADATGTLALRSDDLSPLGDLLPEALRTLLPARGHLEGRFARGVLQVDAATLEARGIAVQVDAGALPLVANLHEPAPAEVHFAVTMSGFATKLVPLDAATFTGAASGTVTGTLAEPRLRVDLDLGTCGFAHGTLESARGRVLLDPRSLAVEGLKVAGIRAPALADVGPLALVLDASCALGETGPVLEPLVAKLELDGRMPTALLAPYFRAAALSPAPEGPVHLSLDARHDATGIVLRDLRLHTDTGAPFAVRLAGAGRVPLQWNPTAGVRLLEEGSTELRFDLRRAGEDALACSGTLRVGAHEVTLDPCALAAFGAKSTASLALGLGLDALIGAGPDAGKVRFVAACDFEGLALARLPRAWLGTQDLRGDVAGHLRLERKDGALVPEGWLTLAEGSLGSTSGSLLSGATSRIEVRREATPRDVLGITLAVAAKLDAGSGVAGDLRWTSTLALAEDGARLEPSVVHFGASEIALEATSDLRLSEVLAGTVLPKNHTLVGTVGVRELGVEPLLAFLQPEFTKNGGQVRGVVAAEAELSGSLGAPLDPAMVQRVTLTLRDGEVKAGTLPRFENLRAEVACDRHTITLRSLDGTLGAGRFSARGTLRDVGRPLWQDLENATLDAKVTGTDVLLYRGEGAKVRADVDLSATGTLKDVALSGDLALGRGSKFVRRISLIPDLKARGGETANEGLRLAELPPELGDRLRLDVALKTSEAFEVKTNVFDGAIDVAARLRGKGTAPRIEGTMAMRSGMLRFPGANLRVASGLLSFTRTEPRFPELLVTAEGKRMGIAITMTLTGRYDRPQMQLSSVPPLPPQDLIVLLTTGQLPSTLSERSAQEQARFVGGYLAKEIVESYFGSDSTERGESLLDRLTIETGREVSKNGIESVLVEFEITKELAVQAERDAYEDYNLGLVLRYRFR